MSSFFSKPILLSVSDKLIKKKIIIMEQTARLDICCNVGFDTTSIVDTNVQQRLGGGDQSSVLIGPTDVNKRET